jgi:hypothetical protein
MGGIRIIIEYEKDGNIKKHIIKTTRETIDKVIDVLYMRPETFIEYYESVPEIIPFSIIITILEDYNMQPKTTIDYYGAGYIFNRIAIARIVEEMKKPRIEEEGILNYLFNEISNHKYVFEWGKRKEVIKAIDIDPNEIIFVDDNFVYIPRVFVSARIKNSFKPRRDLENALGVKLRTFNTSYSKGGFKINVIYILIPQNLIEEKIGKK